MDVASKSSSKPTPPPPRWVLDLGQETPNRTKSGGIPDPPGYSAIATKTKVIDLSRDAVLTAHNLLTGIQCFIEAGAKYGTKDTYACRNGLFEA